MRVGLPSSEFGRGVTVLMGGTLAAQALPLLASPALTRLYDPEQFGLYGLFVAVVAITVGAVTGRYELTVVLPRRAVEARTLLWVAIGIAFIVCSALQAVASIYADDLANWAGLPAFAPWVPWVPAAVFPLAVYQTLGYWLIREKAFVRAGVNKVSQSLANVIVTLALGVAAVQGGLILGYLAGWLGGIVVALRQVGARALCGPRLRARGIARLAARYRSFPLYGAMPAVLDTGALMVPQIIVSTAYSAEAGGQFALARQILGAPVMLVSAAIGQVLLRRLAVRRSQGQEVRAHCRALLVRITALAVLFAVTTMIGSPLLFTFLFGGPWQQAGEFAQVLAIAFAARLAVYPFTSVFPAMERMRIAGFWQVGYFLSIASLGFLTSMDIHDLLWVYAAMELALYLAYLRLAWGVIEEYERRRVSAST